MALKQYYRDYFDIDPEYFPAVNQDVMEKDPDLWKKFYPHETFVKLLQSTVDVLERKKNLNLWVEGAYGTGKSHAVLTLKNLLEAGEEETQEYFQKFQLDKDLQNRLQSLKNSGKILTVHRYGSSSIHGDNNLFPAIQKSIEKTLEDAKLEGRGSVALKDSVLRWLAKYPQNRDYFGSLIAGPYSDLFGGDKVEDVEYKLRTYQGDALVKIMSNIITFGEDTQIDPFTLNAEDLVQWIREVISANQLQALVFIWDEFTEYLRSNAFNLTGFQRLCELSETTPFCFIVVTHVTQGLFMENDPDFKKLNDRFVNPHCHITLPDNIAFQLMGAAMEKNNNNPVIADDWNKVQNSLKTLTMDARQTVMSSFNIAEADIAAILPIHPYAAMLLQQISSAFDSNQRSMFDFIKNDRGDEIKGFQWFIDHYGPTNRNPLLTVDMLWDFFYEKGKESLTHDIRSILDYYGQVQNQKLDDEQQRVLKTVLLLQAISQHAGNAVELYLPTEKNVDMAFQGTDVGKASHCADLLVKNKILYKKSLGNGKEIYAAYSGETDVDVTEQEKQIDARTTTELINEELADKSKVSDAIALGGALKLRYVLQPVSISDFDTRLRQIRNNPEKNEHKIVALVCFAKNEAESGALRKNIREAMTSVRNDVIIIDVSGTPFGQDGYGYYRHNVALSLYYRGKDNSLANQYVSDARAYLKKWKDRIAGGEFVVYTPDKPGGELAGTLDTLEAILSGVNRKQYPQCLEGTYKVIANMYTPSNLKQGVECGCEQKTSGTYKSSIEATKLESALEGAWQVENYWEKSPYLPVSKIKIFVDGMIQKEFDASGRISIRDIYNALQDPPYGFMACNFSAFMLGFLLKEYAKGDYSWSDALTSAVLDTDHLKNMIDEVIRLDITPNPRYKEKYIVAVTPEMKAFYALASEAFGIPLQYCSSLPNTREQLRGKMKELAFPIWTLKSILADRKLETQTGTLEQLLDLFGGVANSSNLAGGGSENDIAMEIGTLALGNPAAGKDLHSLLNQNSCKEGMAAFLNDFDDGRLPALAKTVGDGGQYINVLRHKFDADAANWVWNEETGQEKIREVILEYEIIAESNKIISKCTSYPETIKEWSDRCDSIRISFQAAKNYLDDLEPLLELLYSLKKNDSLKEDQKKPFLDQLRKNGDAFSRFYSQQTEMFKQVCSFYLEDLTDENIRELFDTIHGGCFTDEKSNYFNMVDKAAADYRSRLKSVQLQKIWKENTSSDSPAAWSKAHRMPILCLIPYDELDKADAAFSAVNSGKADSDAADKAMEYLQNASFYDKLEDEAALDKIFRETILKNNAVLLTDTGEAKNYIEKHLAEPYDWWKNSQQIDKLLAEMAEAKYNQSGCDQALAKIDRMDADSAKHYLKELIKDNMAVGIEILKDSEG